MSRTLVFFAVTSVFAFASLARAQTTTARISGVLTDETGAVLPSGQLTVANVETGFSRTLLTDAQGRFVVPQLPPGPYQITATVAGFETLTRKGITLSVGQEVNLTLPMKVGAVTEQVTVTGEAPLVNTSGSAVSGVVEEKRIAELPLNGRDFTKLALVQPGVFLARKTDSGRATKGFGTRISMAGSRVDQTAWLLDGTNIKGAAIFGVPGSAAGLVLGVDAVREFQVLTSNFSAEFGGTSGGVVNMISKSGTNELHGSLYVSHRNDNLDARNFFDRDPSNPLKRSDPPEFKRNQFGGSLGGHIKKDKTFYFGNYEGLREGLGLTKIAVVPDQNAHQGLIPTPTGSLQRVEVAPEIRPFLDLYPLPNGPVVGINSGLAQLITPVSQVTAEDYFITRVDHHISDNQSIFSRFTFDQAERGTPDTIPITSTGLITRARYATLQYQSIVTPQFLATTRVAYNRTIVAQSASLNITFPPAAFLFSKVRPTGIGFAGATSYGIDLPLTSVHNLYQFTEDMVYTRGIHSMKFGFDFQKLGMNYDGGTRDFATFGWGSMQDFLEDRRMQSISVAAVGTSSDRSLRQRYFGLYFQDDWKWRPRFTINLGVRYEPFTVPTEKWGRLSQVRDWVTATQFETNIPFFKNTTKKNISPRVGFAWDPQGHGKTAVRGGFGLFFVQITGPHYRTQAFRSPPFYGLIQQPLGNLASAVADVARVGPTLLSVIMNPNTFMQLPDYNLSSSYEMKFNLSVERELSGGVSLGVGYIGGRGIHLWRVTSSNAAPSTIVNGREFVAAGTPRVNPNTGAGAINYSDVQSFYNGLQAEVKKRFSRGFQFQTAYTWSKSIDDSTTGGVATDYLEGDSSRPYNTKADRGLSAFHVGQNIVVNGIYSLPSPQSSTVVNRLLGGWQLSAIFAAASGMPFSAEASGRNAPDLSRSAGRQRPDLLAGRSNDNIVSGMTAGCSGVPVGQKLGGPDLYFDPCAFELPPAGFYGNAGRNILLGPGLLNFDFSLQKSTPLGFSEGSRLEFRADFFNLFNRANFGTPSGPVLNATNRRPIAGGGLITDTATAARQLQFGLRIVF